MKAIIRLCSIGRAVLRLCSRLLPHCHRWHVYRLRTTEGMAGTFTVRECRCGRREVHHEPCALWDEWQEESVARFTLLDSARADYRRWYRTAVPEHP